MKKAWVENNVIRDICNGNPDLLYRPEIAANYVAEVSDDIVKGASLIDGVWVNPVWEIPPVPVSTPVLPIISPVEFKLLFTPQERINIKAAQASDEVIDDFFTILDDTRLKYVNLNLMSTQAAVDYLYTKGLITSERKTVIMTGVLE